MLFSVTKLVLWSREVGKGGGGGGGVHIISGGKVWTYSLPNSAHLQNAKNVSTVSLLYSTNTLKKLWLIHGTKITGLWWGVGHGELETDSMKGTQQNIDTFFHKLFFDQTYTIFSILCVVGGGGGGGGRLIFGSLFLCNLQVCITIYSFDLSGFTHGCQTKERSHGC